MIGSSINDVLQISSAPKETSAKGGPGAAKEESAVSKIKQHKKILDRGKPDDVMPDQKFGQDSLPVLVKPQQEVPLAPTECPSQPPEPKKIACKLCKKH